MTISRFTRSGIALPATGKVLQVVSATTSTEVGSTSATYVDTNLTATITPNFASSKIFVIVSQQGYAAPSSDETLLGLRLLRGATTLYTNNRSLGLNQTSGAVLAMMTLSNLDSPATTAATTYKTQFARAGGSGSVSVNTSSNTSVITLFEIGA